MLDPISALSVASAAIQLVDFSRKIVCKGKQLYNSADGILDDNRDAETVTIRLKQMTEALQKSLSSAKPDKSDSKESRQQQELFRNICTDCTSSSDKLLNRLYKLKVPPGDPHRKWKSFRQALKSVWSKEELNSLAENLVRLREELNTNMLFYLRDKFDVMAIQNDLRFNRCDGNTRKIIQSLTDTHATQSSEIRRQFQTLTAQQQKEFERTRAVFIERDCEKRRARIELDLLDSLRFPEMSHRYASISQAHTKTFKWIFRDPQAFDKPWDNFKRWLSHGSGVYWMQGKAASGKSTLMRFIWDHPAAIESLNIWAQDCSTLFTGAFFFWNSGILEQRSQIGLLQTLLYAVLKGQRNLIPVVFSEEWERKSALAASDMQLSPERWSLGRLQDAFKLLIRQAGPNFKLCFFIDGLDEYEGNSEDIADSVVHLARSSKHVKFCVSSRPWPVFQDIFRHCLGLRLQDLTKDDIRAYVIDLLMKSRQMQNFFDVDPGGSSDLIEEVVNKAEGVFLWVVLVVRSLINGLRNGDDISFLRRRLASIPSDIERLFDHMLNGVEAEYQEECSKIFQIFRASGHNLGTLTLHRALLYSDYQEVLDLNVRNEIFRENHQTSVTLERIAMKVNSRTKGLLEVHTVANSFENPDSETVDVDQPRGGIEDTSSSSNICRDSIGSDDACLLLQNETNSILKERSQKAEAFSIEYNSEQRDYGGRCDGNTDPNTAHSENPTVDGQSKRRLAKQQASRITYNVEQKNYQSQYSRRTNRKNGLRKSSGPDASATRSSAHLRNQLRHPTLVLKQIEERSPLPNLSHSFNSALPRRIKSELTGQSPDTDNRNGITVRPLSEGPPHISYLHRTARDYIEQPGVWRTICGRNNDSSFDPVISLIMSYVLLVKTTPFIQYAPSVYEAGTGVLASLARLDAPNSAPSIQLVEEIDKILTAHWSGTNGVLGKGHWSNSIPGWHDRFEERKALQGDILVMSLKSGLNWYADAKPRETASSGSSVASQHIHLPFTTVAQDCRPPLVIQVLSFELWGCHGKAPTPDATVVEKLLLQGYDPNETYRAHTVWQYVLHYVHILTKILEKDPDFKAWQQVFRVMLTNGADPDACCIKDCRAFALSVALSSENDIGYNLDAVANHTGRIAGLHPSAQKTYYDPGWAGGSAYGVSHSVAAVVYDAFVDRSIDGSEQLLQLVQEKQN